MAGPANDIDALLGLTAEEAERQSYEEEAERAEKTGISRFSDITADAPEFRRIAGLARRTLPESDSPEVEELIDFIVDRFALVDDPYPGRPMPHQALAVKEWFEQEGGVGMLQVGAGKTWLAGIMGTVFSELLGSRGKVLVLTKSAMTGDTEREFCKMRNSWRMVPKHQLKVLAYEKISQHGNSELHDSEGRVIRKSLLERLGGVRVLICDEAHCAGDSGAAVSNRIAAFVEDHPDTIVIMMTGTFFKTSIKDGQKLMELALGNNCPLPCDFHEREAWASYLDARKMGRRVGVGDLLQLLTPKARAEYEAEPSYEEKRGIVRRGVALWMLETPGVIGTQDLPVEGVELRIDHIYPDYETDEVAEAFTMLRGSPNEEDGMPPWRTPEGEFLPDAIQAAAKGYQEGLGFWNKPVPPAPDDYRLALSEWNKWCNKMIRFNKLRIDSEYRVKDATRKRIFNDRYNLTEARLVGNSALAGESRLALWEAASAAYKEATGLPEPPSIAQWLSAECIDTVRRWIKAHGGVVWVDSIGLGERLSKELKIPYYHQGGLDARKRRIADHPPGTPAIASLKACGTGKNLQGVWNKNLWLCTPSEQSLGRTHRKGQKKPVVYNWIYVGCYEHLKAFHAARDTKASFQEDMQLNPQKLRFATVIMPSGAELEARDPGNPQSRWSRPVAGPQKPLDG